MERIHDVIRNTATPSWVRHVPYNFGDPAAGTMKADEWRTMFTIYLPIALISLWGQGTLHSSVNEATHLQRILDHTMNLVCAVGLACRRTMTTSRAQAYRKYMAAWVSDLTTLHPHVTARPNGHMALHIYDFLLLFCPVRSWWCFPFERLIGMLQRIPNSHKFGLFIPYDVVVELC
jgi:nitrate reductase gamma subunit